MRKHMTTKQAIVWALERRTGDITLYRLAQEVALVRPPVYGAALSSAASDLVKDGTLVRRRRGVYDLRWRHTPYRREKV